jgi:hypothetical protein
LLLQDFDSIKEQLDLLELLGHQRRLLPPVTRNWTSIQVHTEEGSMLLA